MGAVAVAVLRLPWPPVVVTLLLTLGAGVTTTPLITVSVVISHLVLNASYQLEEALGPKRR